MYIIVYPYMYIIVVSAEVYVYLRICYNPHRRETRYEECKSWNYTSWIHIYIRTFIAKAWHVVDRNKIVLPYPGRKWMVTATRSAVKCIKQVVTKLHIYVSLPGCLICPKAFCIRISYTWTFFYDTRKDKCRGLCYYMCCWILCKLLIFSTRRILDSAICNALIIMYI